VTKLVKTINKIPFAPVVAIAFGVMSAILVIAMPQWRFHQMINASGLPNVLSFARPPLGDTARGLTALIAGVGVAALLWLGLSSLSVLMKGSRKGPKARGRRIDPAVVPPNADAGLPQRRPIFAERDLGAPFMSDEVLAKQPLETPAESPFANVPPVPPIAPVPTIAPVEIAAPQQPVFAPLPPFAPKPPVDAAPEPVLPIERSAAPEPAPAAQSAEPSVADLMARLDAALERRQKRGIAQPAGDIASLRQALGGLTIARQ
jgi:hypothetical protein